MSSRLCKILKICEDNERLNDEDGAMLMYHIAKEMNSQDRKKVISQMILAMRSQISNQSLDEILAFKQGRKLEPKLNSANNANDANESNVSKNINATQKQEEQEEGEEKQTFKDVQMKQGMKSGSVVTKMNQKSAADDDDKDNYEQSSVEVKESKLDTAVEQSQVLATVDRLTIIPHAIFQHIAAFVEKKQWLRLSRCNHRSYYMIHNQVFFIRQMAHSCWHQHFDQEQTENMRRVWQLCSDDIPDIIKNPSKYEARFTSTKVLYLRPPEYGRVYCLNRAKKCNFLQLIDACKNDDRLKWFLQMLSKIEALRISCRWICAYQHIPFKCLLLRDPDINDDIQYPFPLKMISVADRGVNASPLDNRGVEQMCKKFDEYFQMCTQTFTKDTNDQNIKPKLKIRPINEVYYPFCTTRYYTDSRKVSSINENATIDTLLQSKLPQYVNTAYLFVRDKLHRVGYFDVDNYQAALRFASPQQFRHFFHPKTDTVALEICNFTENETDFKYRYLNQKYPFAEYFFQNEQLIQYFHPPCKSTAAEDDQSGKSEDVKKETYAAKDEKDDSESETISQEMKSIKQWLNIKKLEIRCKESNRMIFFTRFIDDPYHRKLWNFFNFTNTIETLELKLHLPTDIKHPLNSLIVALKKLTDLKMVFVLAELGASNSDDVQKMAQFLKNDFGDVLRKYFASDDQVENQTTDKMRTLTMQWREGPYWLRQYNCTFIIDHDENDNQDKIYDGFKGKYATIETATHESAIIASSKKYQDIEFGWDCQKCIRYQNNFEH